MGKYIKDSEIYLPDINETNWGTKVNKNFEILNNVKTNVNNNSTAINRMESDIANNKNRLDSLSDVPTKLSQLENDTGYLTSASLPTVPTKLSQLENDVGFVTGSVSGNNLFDVYEEYLYPFVIQVSKTPVLDSSIQGSADSSTLDNIDNVKFKTVEDVLCNLNVYTNTHMSYVADGNNIYDRCNFTYIGDNDDYWYFAIPLRSVSVYLWINAYRCSPTFVNLYSTETGEGVMFTVIKISQMITDSFQTEIIVDGLACPLYSDDYWTSINYVVDRRSDGKMKFNFIKPKYGYIL